MAKKNIDPGFKANPDEIESLAWVSYNDFPHFLAEKKLLDNGEGDVTPWFKLMVESKLMGWWKHIIESGKYPKDESERIERFTGQ